MDDLLEISYVGKVVDTGAIFDGSAVKINGGVPPAGFTDEDKKTLEREIKIRDDIIHELEMRLAMSDRDSKEREINTPKREETNGGDAAVKVELDILSSQVEALHAALAQKESEMGRLEGELRAAAAIKEDSARSAVLEAEVKQLSEELSSTRSEQEDLLMMLADQDVKMAEYAAKLKAMGVSVETLE